MKYSSNKNLFIFNLFGIIGSIAVMNIFGIIVILQGYSNSAFATESSKKSTSQTNSTSQIRPKGTPNGVFYLHPTYKRALEFTHNLKDYNQLIEFTAALTFDPRIEKALKQILSERNIQLTDKIEPLYLKGNKLVDKNERVHLVLSNTQEFGFITRSNSIWTYDNSKSPLVNVLSMYGIPKKRLKDYSFFQYFFNSFFQKAESQGAVDYEKLSAQGTIVPNKGQPGVMEGYATGLFQKILRIIYEGGLTPTLSNTTLTPPGDSKELKLACKSTEPELAGVYGFPRNITLTYGNDILLEMNASKAQHANFTFFSYVSEQNKNPSKHKLLSGNIERYQLKGESGLAEKPSDLKSSIHSILNNILFYCGELYDKEKVGQLNGLNVKLNSAYKELIKALPGTHGISLPEAERVIKGLIDAAQPPASSK